MGHRPRPVPEPVAHRQGGHFGPAGSFFRSAYGQQIKPVEGVFKATCTPSVRSSAVGGAASAASATRPSVLTCRAAARSCQVNAKCVEGRSACRHRVQDRQPPRRQHMTGQCSPAGVRPEVDRSKQPAANSSRGQASGYRQR